jgi:ABC-type uncharacterized transport system auxiliary subunit
MNTKIRFSALTLPALFLLLTVLSACSGVLTSEQPAKQYYTLMPYKSTGGAANVDAAPALAISVAAVPGLDTDRILALDTDARLNRYANARWPDHLPEVLTSVMKRSLLASGRFSAVDSGRTSGDGWGLKLEVQQFYGIRDGAGTTSSVLIEMAGDLKCNGGTEHIELSDSSRVAEERLSAIVAAHQASLDEVTRQLVARIAEICEAG